MTCRGVGALGDGLVLNIDSVAVALEDEYAIAGVYSFGKGLFGRGRIRGAGTAYKTLYRLRAGQLVLSRLKAFEGAVAIVPSEFDGWYLSPEFPTFSCIPDILDPGYMAHMCRWPDLWSKLAAGSKGLGARRERVHPDQLSVLKICLPPIDEQQQIAARLDHWTLRADALRRMLSDASPDTITAILPILIDHHLRTNTNETWRIADLADFVSDIVHPGDDPSAADCFVGLQHIESHTGRCLGSAPLGSEKGRKFRFRPGDVIYGYLRPYLNKVWLADRHGLCSVDQYVLRPKPGVSGMALAFALCSTTVLTAAKALTHSLQLPRLRSGLLAEIRVPTALDPPMGLLKRLERTQQLVITLADRRRHGLAVAGALLPSVLNEAFAGPQ